jgi:hypothetical protein
MLSRTHADSQGGAAGAVASRGTSLPMRSKSKIKNDV